MSEIEERVPVESRGEESDDDRRRKAADLNRKATEELWERNKREWLEKNFPDKLKEGVS